MAVKLGMQAGAGITQLRVPDVCREIGPRFRTGFTCRSAPRTSRARWSLKMVYRIGSYPIAWGATISATRNLALRARGFAATSASLAVMGFLVSVR